MYSLKLFSNSAFFHFMVWGMAGWTMRIMVSGFSPSIVGSRQLPNIQTRTAVAAIDDKTPAVLRADGAKKQSAGAEVSIKVSKDNP